MKFAQHKRKILGFFILLMAIHFIITFFGGWGLMFDLEEPSSNTSEPVEFYSIGRMVLPAPKALQYLGTSCRVDYIHINEKKWMQDDHKQEWRATWQPVRDAGEKNYLQNKEANRTRLGGFAEKDIAELFGVNSAILLCYAKDGATTNLESYTALPQTLLRLTEERVETAGTECSNTDISSTQLPIFKNYRYGKNKPKPDSFFTEQGHIENLKFKYEDTRAYFGLTLNDNKHISLNLLTYIVHDPSDNDYKKITELLPIARVFGANIKLLRSQRRDFNGMEGWEEVAILTEKKSRGGVTSALVASWRIKGEMNNPERPYIDIEITTEIISRDGKESFSNNKALKEQSLRMWKAVTDQFTTAQEYYSR